MNVAQRKKFDSKIEITNVNALIYFFYFLKTSKDS